ncbi:hypothetical protein ACIRP0_26635 [Streptomyces sp. NPDC101733]|uniref:hypothetical protein n=1 Tax=unclassified Streptomyces TaxID=2593676 RepID=UPI003809D498
MTTNENSLPLDGDIRPLDNHASGIEIKPLDPSNPPSPSDPSDPKLPPGTATSKPADNHASDEEIVTLDNHASGPPRP